MLLPQVPCSGVPRPWSSAFHLCQPKGKGRSADPHSSGIGISRDPQALHTTTDVSPNKTTGFSRTIARTPLTDFGCESLVVASPCLCALNTVVALVLFHKWCQTAGRQRCSEEDIDRRPVVPGREDKCRDLRAGRVLASNLLAERQV